MRMHGVLRGGAVLLAVAVGAGLLLGGGRASAAPQPGAASRTALTPPGPGISHAYQFLNQMMDRYAKGSVSRLVQSYTGGVLGAENYTASSTYDDALVIDAYLAQRTPGGQARAETIGNALLTALAQSAPQDGGLDDDYAPDPLRLPAGVQPEATSQTTGDASWAGDALVQLYAATRL